MLIQRCTLGASLLVLALVSACTTTSHGEPRPVEAETATSGPAPTTSGNSDEELPFAGAPKVDDPLDTSRYEQDPCLTLTAEQTEPLNLPGKGEINDKVALGIGCDWFNRETRGEVSINFIVDDPRGLSPEYESEQQGEFPDFTELPAIDGYPAITRDGASEYGDCTIVVGVADDMAFESIVQLSQANVGQKDPCEVAVEVAGLALQTMKAGA